jgi:CheY-like chemotaxis protein
VTAIAQSPPGLKTSSLTRVQVLVVDDDDDQRHLLRIHFENAGCDVTVADSAESAITAYQGEDIDLAVTELLLPGMDGWTLSERIGVDQPDCRIAICSVLDKEDYPSACVPLPKPVTRASVRSVLQKYVPSWISP